MSRQATVAEYAQFQRIADVQSENPFLRIHRPIHIFRREGEEVVLSERRHHLDLLIDKRSRERRLFHRLATAADRARWKDIAKDARRVEWPITCYAKQLPMILDYEHKIVGSFGGNRSGKTHGMLQWFCDKIVSLGGKGAQFWVVAPHREGTQIAVEKLVQGQNTGGRPLPPIVPPELVISWPKTHLSTDQTIYLVDGSRIALKHASRKGDNLKGRSPVCVMIDEGTEIQHEINHTILVNRVLDARGQIGYATTPVGGHWLESQVFEPGMTYAEASAAESEGKRVNIISEEYSMFDNPWQHPDEIEITIETLGGRDSNKVQREVFGRWVQDGNNLWTGSFDDERNTFQGPGRDAADYGAVNINKVALGKKFRRFEGDWRYVGGMDFNFDPMSVLACQVECPPDCDQSDRSNWTLRVLDEAVRRAENIYSFATWLNRAGIHRGQPKEIFAKMPIICDASGAYLNPPENHKVPAGVSLAKVMEEHGFGCKPCGYSKTNRKPKNPGILDSVSLCHLKFKEGKIKIHADRCPQLLYSVKHQLRDDHGMPAKVSNTASDKLSGPIDALRYLVWSIWGSRPPAKLV